MATPAHPGRRLTDQVVDSLVDRLRRREWEPGERLPTEHELAAHYGVSRATVRTALSHLETLGFTVTRHGLGTFPTQANSEIRADLRRLDSLSATVSSYGMEPGMTFRSRRVRPAAPDEATRLKLEPGAEVFATERAITADGTVVAFSYDAIDVLRLGEDFEPDGVEGSLFSLLASSGIEVSTAIAEVHSVADPDVGWGPRPRSGVYLLLSQVHHDRHDRPVMASNTFFVEGRFTFSLVRVR